MSKREAARWSLKVYRWVEELRDVMAARERARNR
jgi:hypothetical protein